MKRKIRIGWSLTDRKFEKMALQSTRNHECFSPSPPLEGGKAHEDEKGEVQQHCLSLDSCANGRNKTEPKSSEPKVHRSDSEETALEGLSATSVDEMQKPTTSEALPEDIGRERLNRHRREMAGRVWIPEIWGQEELLKDWIDCSAFDDCLFPSGIGLARAALIEEGRRANSGGLRLENRC